MKPSIIVAILNFISLVSFAQKETSQWFFGIHNAFDFDTNPVSFFSNKGSTYTYGSTASICDPNGNLLFYTDGQTVWNRKNQIMPNGKGLKGHSGALGQKCLIVPVGRGKHKLYYIFTSDGSRSDLDYICCFPNDSVFAYSIVDMEKDGGFGDITIKNIKLTSPVDNSIAAVKHANGIDTWVLTHKLFTNEFYAYLITECGIHPPIVSAIGLKELYGFPTNLAISPNGKKVSYYAGTINSDIQYLFDFDNTNGNVSNPIALANKTGAEGCCFSPNSRFIYISSLNGFFDQFDLEAPDVINSRRTLRLQTDGLQLGLDGKLYIANEIMVSIDVLNNPNEPLDTANYEYMKYKVNRITFAGNNTSLPTFISSYFDPSYKSPIEPNFITTRACVNQSNKFVLNTNQFSSSLLNAHWDFGDGQTSASLNPLTLTDTTVHAYTKPGIYTVKLILDYGCKKDSIENEIMIDSIPSVHLGNDKKICEGTIEKLSAPSGYLTYTWNEGNGDSVKYITQPGIYNVSVSNTCGTAYDTITFSKREIFIPNLTTPNADQKNDKLEIKGLDNEFGALTIYNCWGTLIYNNDNYQNNWGTDQEEGIYYYNFKFETCPDIKGWIQVIK